MARKLIDIYNSIREKRSEYMQLTSFENDSKMSISNALMYIMASGIWSLENMIEVFKVDVAKSINSHINGTEAYYINALKNYQQGDTLVVSEDGCSFKYPEINESKRIIKSAVCYLTNISGFYDRKLTFKVATGSGGSFEQIDEEELVNIRNYMRKIMFAGTNLSVDSCRGDVMVPKIVVSYDGSIQVAELKDSIVSAIKGYLESTAFTGKFYPSKLLSCIGNVEHVCDVISDGIYDNVNLGIYVAQYDEIGNVIVDSASNSPLVRFVNGVDLSSGYIREIDDDDTFEGAASWEDSIIVITEADLEEYTLDSRLITLSGNIIQTPPTLVINGAEKAPYNLL